MPIVKGYIIFFIPPPMEIFPLFILTALVFATSKVKKTLKIGTSERSKFKSIHNPLTRENIVKSLDYITSFQAFTLYVFLKNKPGFEVHVMT